MKTDTLQDSLEKYRQKIAGSARNRAAAYELALASGRGKTPALALPPTIMNACSATAPRRSIFGHVDNLGR